MEKSIVRQVDHIMIESDDPASLFSWFKEVLGLPEAWAMKDFGGMFSGGVTVGNANLEFVRFKSARFGHPVEDHPPKGGARVAGIAFEPNSSTDLSIKELDARDIPHGDAHRTPNWTDTVISGLLDDPDVAFLAEYHFDHRSWRKALSEALAKTSGGKLGIVGVKEIHVRQNPNSVAESFWKKIFDPNQESPQNCWTIGAGPRLRFSQGEGNSIVSFTFEVRSLTTALDFLRGKELLGLSSDERVLINPAAVQGIQIYLSESTP
jgi:catechol 2,3-dioxygenase-like lactoylglutathione lyase family enzyme